MSLPAYLLVTTSQSLLLLNSCDGTAYRIVTGREHYYGITRDVHHDYVGVRCRANASPVPKAEEHGKILRFDRSMRAGDTLEPDFAMRDVHQVLVRDGKRWVTCSFDNMGVVYDGLTWDAWYPPGPPAVEPFDVNHFFGKTLRACQTITSCEEGMVTDIMAITVSQAAYILDVQDRPETRCVVSAL